MSTLSRTTSSCDRRFATSGAMPPVSRRMSSIFFPPTVSPSFFIFAPPKRAWILTPDFSRGFDHQLELPPLVVLAQPVAHLARREAALRREAQVFQRDVFRRFVHASFQSLLVLELRCLRRDQAEHDLLALGH